MNCAQNVPIVGQLQTLGINRGTTKRYRARRLDYAGHPILTEAASIYFIVKKNWTDKEALITKTIDDMRFDENGYYHFSIEPEDTENLPYGQYVWDFTSNTAGDNDYRAKPAHGYFVIGNSAGWIVNQEEA